MNCIFHTEFSYLNNVLLNDKLFLVSLNVITSRPVNKVFGNFLPEFYSCGGMKQHLLCDCVCVSHECRLIQCMFLLLDNEA